MKRALYLLVLSTFLFSLESCSNSDDTEEMTEMGSGEEGSDDDNSNGDEEEDMALSYYALKTNDRLIYDVSTGEMEATKDTLTVVAPVMQDDQIFADLEASETSTGFMSNLLGGGLLLEENAQLVYSGTLTIAVDPENPFTVEIPSSIVYDEAVAAGVQLSSNNQTITQEIDGQPITIDVIATTRQLNIIENYTVNGFTFESAIQSELTVNATISTEIFGITVTLLEAQDVVVATNFYGQDTGLVDSTVNFQYEFVDLSPFGIELPFPSAASNVSTQSVIDIRVAN